MFIPFKIFSSDTDRSSTGHKTSLLSQPLHLRGSLRLARPPTDAVHSSTAAQDCGAGEDGLDLRGPVNFIGLGVDSEVQRGGVDAVSQSCGLRTVLKDVAEVTSTFLA